MIISVHVPKAAGTTLLRHLKENFDVYEDTEFREIFPGLYAQNKSNPGIVHSTWMRVGIAESILRRSRLVDKSKTRIHDCIHGHFHIAKYRFYPNARFITFLRDPLQRMVSHYYYWKKVYESGNAGDDLYLSFLFDRKTSLAEFLFDKNLQDYQSKFIGGRSALSRYVFIGLADENYFADDMNYLFSQILKCPLLNSSVGRLNSTDYSQSASEVDIKAFRDFHKKDYEAYNYALQRRAARAPWMGN